MIFLQFIIKSGFFTFNILTPDVAFFARLETCIFDSKEKKKGMNKEDQILCEYNPKNEDISNRTGPGLLSSYI